MPARPSRPASAAPEAPSASTALTAALTGLAALAIAMGVGRFAFTPVLPMMLHDRVLSIDQGGWLASINYLGYLIGAVSAMALPVRAETAIRGGLATIAFTTLAMALPLPFSLWMLLRLCAGVASAWVLISVTSWSLGILMRLQRPMLGGVVFTGVGAGIAAAGLLCVVLLRLDAPAAQAWFALGIASLLVTALIWRRFLPQAQAAVGADAPRRRLDADARRLVFCYGVFGFGYIIPATYLPLMAKQALQGTDLFVWSWPVFGLAAALSTLAVAPLARRISHRRLWMASHVVMAIGVALPAHWSNLPAILGAALCVGGTFMVITLAAMQEARRVAGDGAGALIAAMTAAFAAGQIVGPLSVTLVTRGDFSLALLGAALLLLASAVMLRAEPARASGSAV
jgi:predicted MFS family arabinose efflux permease